ncbi:hypothetical protein OsI_14299 [Oryza sativa Indica Group]|uniref:Uncharacterized protein n=1 Tax=Oryza sativa subsp. indica TaxID=39946 RepID=A2XNZ9_ORYSI|nr:hypothetical protein OsI_14299 [Oryza sativa Indica Group]
MAGEAETRAAVEEETAPMAGEAETRAAVEAETTATVDATAVEKETAAMAGDVTRDCDQGHWCDVKTMTASKGGSQMRFYGERLMKISKSLSKEATSVIRKLQFEPSLIISLNNLDACRGLIFWIASNCKVAKFNNEDVIVLNVNPETPRLITPAVLGVIHGYPRGVLLNNTPDPDSPPLKNILEHPHAKLEDLQEAIFAAKQKRLKQNLVHDKKTNPYNLLSIEDIDEACQLPGAIITPCWKSEHQCCMTCCMTNSNWQIFFLDNLDWAATTSNDPMKTPRLQYYTKSVLDKFVDLLEDSTRIKLKPWDRTVYAHKGIPEVQPDQLEYTVVGKDNVKKRSRSGKSGIGKTVEEEDCKKKGKSEKNKRPFQEEDDSFP